MFKEYGELGTILYEATKPVGHSVDGDIEYYLEKLKCLDGVVLEAGVGTGRLLIPFIESGLSVDGVDLSLEMLEQCRFNMKKHGISANLYKQDLTSMSLPNKYGAIIMPTGSFCLLPKEKVREVLAGFYDHLKSGGKVILDLEMPTDFKQGEMAMFSKQLSENTGIMLTCFNESIDWRAQKTRTILKYELLKDGEIIKTEVSDFILHWYGIVEFELLLQAAGFVDIKYEVGYGKDEKSSLVTFIASIVN